LLVINKWDLAEQKATQEAYIKYLNNEMKGFNFAPVAYVSAINGLGVTDVIQATLSLHEQSGTRVSTSEMNKTMEQLLAERTPISGVGRRPKIYYATQLAVHPPTIGVFVNNPDLFDQNYQRFLLNRFRDLLPYPEVPIKLVIRGKEHSPDKANAKKTPRDKGKPKPTQAFTRTPKQRKIDDAGNPRPKRKKD
jgi:GTP-binding protein